jgi:hypothetical protein
MSLLFTGVLSMVCLFGKNTLLQAFFDASTHIECAFAAGDAGAAVAAGALQASNSRVQVLCRWGLHVQHTLHAGLQVACKLRSPQ